MHARRIYEFGHFRLHSSDRTLSKNGKSVPLHNKAILILLALLEDHGVLVTKEQLLDRVWKDTFVDEGVLSRYVCVIRKVLEDSGTRFIETIPKRGYRFSHAVTVHNDFEHSKQPISVAVLPFRVIAQDDSHRYLGFSLADAVISRLGSIQKMVVRPTSAVSRYTDGPVEAITAARELCVEAILEGTLRMQGDRVRLILHLVSARDNAPLWSSTFDCSFSDLFELEDRIAVQVATALVLRLSGTEREAVTRPATTSAEAYRLYLKARYLLAFVDWSDLTAPIRYLEQALLHDPEFVECYATIATWYTAMTIHGSTNPNEMVPKAKEAALKALRLNRHHQQARAALAFAVWHYDYEWEAAEVELRRMVDFAPNDPFPRHLLAMMLAETDRHDQAMQQLDTAQRLEPSSAILSSAGLVCWMIGRYEDAIERSRAALKADPGCVRAMWTLGMASEQLAEHAAAVRWLCKAAKASHGASMMKASLAHAYVLAGQVEKAQALISELEEQSKSQYVPSAEIAYAYVALGKKDHAFDLLFRSVGEHSVCLVLAAVDPRLNPLRNDPRFEQLLRAIGLPAPARKSSRTSSSH